jgi:hypothetical protein
MPIPRFTATDRMEFIESICGAVFEEGHQPYDREKLQERLAKLAGGVAIIRVGGPMAITASTPSPAATPTWQRPASSTRRKVVRLALQGAASVGRC